MPPSARGSRLSRALATRLVLAVAVLVCLHIGTATGVRLRGINFGGGAKLSVGVDSKGVNVKLNLNAASKAINSAAGADVTSIINKHVPVRVKPTDTNKSRTKTEDKTAKKKKPQRKGAEFKYIPFDSTFPAIDWTPYNRRPYPNQYENTIERLKRMRYNHTEAREALEITNQDVDMAADYLSTKSPNSPDQEIAGCVGKDQCFFGPEPSRLVTLLETRSKVDPPPHPNSNWPPQGPAATLAGIPAVKSTRHIVIAPVRYNEHGQPEATKEVVDETAASVDELESGDESSETYRKNVKGTFRKFLKPDIHEQQRRELRNEDKEETEAEQVEESPVDMSNKTHDPLVVWLRRRIARNQYKKYTPGPPLWLKQMIRIRSKNAGIDSSAPIPGFPQEAWPETVPVKWERSSKGHIRALWELPPQYSSMSIDQLPSHPPETDNTMRQPPGEGSSSEESSAAG